MLYNRKALLTFLSVCIIMGPVFAVCDKPVCLSIENISDTPYCSNSAMTAAGQGPCESVTGQSWFTGSLDIKMKNQPGGTYYEWTTPLFSSTMTEAECTALSAASPGACTWFNGNVMGFNFVIKSGSITTTTKSYTGGSALDLDYQISINPTWERDADGDGVTDYSGSYILGFTLEATPIPAGDATLVTVGFTGYTGNSICFEELNCDGGCNNVVSDDTGQPVTVGWGDCYCAPDASGNAVVVDCAGTCGGSATLDQCDVCSGTCVEFDTNCPNADGSAHYCNCAQQVKDCSGTCGGFATEDCAGVCAGEAVLDCANECEGTTPDADSDGVCDSDDVCDETLTNVPVASTGEFIGCSEDQQDALAIMLVNVNIPTEFTISQNYPNPFNPVTSISFDVAETDEISLVVYDLSGKEVITLVSGIFMPGSYLVNWDAVNNYGDAIASGMYVYRYISSDKAITRKMLYLK